MAKPKKILKILLGIVTGLTLSHFMFNSSQKMCHNSKISQPLVKLDTEETTSTPQSTSSKNLLFVGVMTAEKYLHTRAKAVYDTWGREVPGKIMFFSSETSYSQEIPLVALRGVDDSYPPQRKSFRMLKFMHDHFIDKYEWFMRADDDVYVRNDKLEELLRSVDSRKTLFIGQTGRGKSEEIGQLSLDSDENFCMGGPGVIMSRATLRKIAPYLEECVENLYTTHEDVEVGRCVRKYAGISCTWSYEMQVIFYHNQSGEAAFSGNLKQKEVHRAITLHPIKRPQQMFRLHKYLIGLKVQNALQKSLLLHRDIASSMYELGYKIESLNNADLAPNVRLFPAKRGDFDYLGNTSFLGIPTSINKYKPETIEDVLEWELISKTLYSHRDLNPRKRIGSSLKEGLGDVVREIMELINSYSKQRGRVIDFREILYGYWRLDPLHGVDLILDLLLVYKKYRGHKMTVQVRRHAYVQQTFTGIFIKEVENRKGSQKILHEIPREKNIVHHIISKISEQIPRIPILNSKPKREDMYINFLLPLSGRYEVFERFLENYEKICIKTWQRTKLLVILYKNEQNIDDFARTMNLVNMVKNRNKNSEILVLKNHEEEFTRGVALQKGLEYLKNDDLMLFIDVDMTFDEKSLERVRKNTILNKSVYFPIVYSLYNPKLLSNDSYTLKKFDYFQLKSNFWPDNCSGFWRQFGFGIASLYKQDFLNLGGFNLQIKGWGAEDVTLFDHVVQSDLKIVRSVDPGLIHVFHDVKCQNDLDFEQKNMCFGTQANTLGCLRNLEQLFLRYKHLFGYS